LPMDVSHRRVALIALLLAAPVGIAVSSNAVIVDVPGSPVGSRDIGLAMTDQPGLFVDACWIHYASGANPVCGADAGSVSTSMSPGGISNETITPVFGPPIGTTFAILTSGSAQYADDPNSGIMSTAYPDTYRNYAYDASTLKIDVMVEAPDNCLQIDVQFLSEEYPSFVNSPYNDAFIAEIDVNDWEITNSAITAPHNFAFDDSGNALTINAAGPGSLTPENAAGSTYGGASVRITVQDAVTPGAHSVYLSVFDAGDHIYDTSIFMDDMRTVETDPRRPCEPGVTLTPATATRARFKAETDADCGIHPYKFTDKSKAGSIWGGVGTIKNWTWSFGDGTGSTEQHPTHTYAKSGTYRVTLTVMDADNRTSTTSQMITVNYDACPPPPAKSQDDPMAARPPRDGTDLEVAEGDLDEDTVPNAFDNCVRIANTAQADMDGDAIGDVCDDDLDNDQFVNTVDNCPATPNSAQADYDADGAGDLCDDDRDGDLRNNDDDNCPLMPNGDQANADGDASGDLCDEVAMVRNVEARDGPAAARSHEGVTNQSTPNVPWNILLFAAIGLALILGLLALVVGRRK
jgi:PKD repeat protein